MKRIFFHVDGKEAYVDVGERQYAQLKREWLKNMNHCDVANESLDEFIGCVMLKYAVILDKPSDGTSRFIRCPRRA